MGGAVARRRGRLVRFFTRSYDAVHGLAAPPVHDPCAVVLVAEPDVIACTTRTSPSSSTGAGRAARPSWTSAGARPANARVALELDVERFWNLVVDGVSSVGR